MAAVKVGDGMAPESQYGAAREPAPRRGDGVAGRGMRGRAVRRSRRAAGVRLASAGFFYEPTVVSGVTRDCQLMNREPFGPICAVMPFARIEEAVTEANRLGLRARGLCVHAFGETLSTTSSRRWKWVPLIGLNTCAVVSPETPWAV